MTQIESILTNIFNFSWTKKCSLERQLLIVFVVEVASVQYKQWQAKAGTGGGSRKNKMEMTKYIVMGFDCRIFSKPIRSNRRSCQKSFEKVSLLGGKNGWENILPETQGLVESRGKKISKTHSLVCPKGESTFVAAILLVGR